ncbi:MAG: beta-galactosidase GalA [Fimbriimonas sp.]|nr:beta-galactosidase GalA [Fimbriimonas sp.]
MNRSWERYRLRSLCPLMALAAIGFISQSALADPARQNFDFGWKFHLGNAADPAKDFNFGMGREYAKAGEAIGPLSLSFDEGDWRSVDLPHDYAVESDFAAHGSGLYSRHGFRPVGREYPESSVGWYRKVFTVPKKDEGKRISLQFDGIYRDAVVFVNGCIAGRNTSGYIGFSCDITDVLRYGQTNIVTVRTDASYFEGWFYEGGGIYRHAWLIEKTPTHIAQDGVYVKSKVRDLSADLTIETEIKNSSDVPQMTKVASAISDPAGRPVHKCLSEAVRVAPWASRTILQHVRIAKPELWDIETPRLYKLATTVTATGDQTDSRVTTFGIRTIATDPNRGILLNGRPLRIKGTCNHQDHAGVGVAVPDSVNRFRIAALKAMGCNAYRTAHNPPSPELLDMCDRMGMLVMDENRVLDGSAEGKSFVDRFVRRDRNHPCVFLWSIGNEESNIDGDSRGKRLAETVVRWFKNLDDTRPITCAANNLLGWDGINEVMPVRGINYFRNADWDKYHRDHPTQPIIGTEEGSTVSTRGEYRTDPAKGYRSAYDVADPGWNTCEGWIQYYAAHPYLGGGFVWTGFDYRGEQDPYGWPCVNSHFGVLDTCGFPKDNFFYYQSVWGARDMVHIVPGTWNWPGKEGQPVNVWIYSNADQVELLLNGKSLGVRPMPRLGHLEWDVPYQAGLLEARAIRKGKVVSTDSIETVGPPERIVLNTQGPWPNAAKLYDGSTIKADGADASVVTVSVVDRNGRVVPYADNDIQFEVIGGETFGVGNGDPSSHEADRFIGSPKSERISGWTSIPASSLEDVPSKMDWTAAPPTDVNGEANQMAEHSFRAFRGEIDVHAEVLAQHPFLMVGQIDDAGVIYLNGHRLGVTNDWSARWPFPEAYKFLKPGLNRIEIVVRNDVGGGGVGRGVSLTWVTPPPTPHRRVFHGFAQVIVGGVKEPGRLVVKATSQHLQACQIEILAK